VQPILPEEYKKLLIGIISFDHAWDQSERAGLDNIDNKLWDDGP
jgi:hypothetical protein